MNCDHDERTLANALARVGTGIINLDLSASYRWVTSLRRHARTAFVELKDGEEKIKLGQLLCLLDLTGTLEATNGLRFEQRSFVLRRNGGGFSLETFWKRGSLNDPPKLWVVLEKGSAEDCASVVINWLRSGSVVYELDRIRN
jgi:hypothetical protein